MQKLNKKQFIKAIREESFKAYCQDILKDLSSKRAIIESNYKQGLTTFEEACFSYLKEKESCLSKYKQAIKFFNIKL